jgi:hypothetical protein
MRSFESPQQHQLQQLSSDALVNEYFSLDPKSSLGQFGGAGQFVSSMRPALPLAPRTFHMDALFNELKQLDSAIPSTAAVSSSALPTTTAAAQNLSPIDAISNEWSQGYLSSLSSALVQSQQQQQQQTRKVIDSSAFKWSADYLAQNEATIFDEAWESVFSKSGHHTSVNNGTSAVPGITTNGNALATGFTRNNDNLIETNKLNEEMLKTANELLDSMQDSRFSETEFLSFVRNLSQNAAAMNAAKTKAPVSGSTAAAGPVASTAAGDLADDWVKEFSAASGSGGQLNGDELDNGTFEHSYWNDLQDEWNNMAR